MVSSVILAILSMQFLFRDVNVAMNLRPKEDRGFPATLNKQAREVYHDGKAAFQ